MSFHYLLASIVSNKKSAIIIFLVLMTCLFSLAAFKVFFPTFFVFRSFNRMLRYGSFYIYSAWVSLNSYIFNIAFLNQIGEVFSHYFIIYFFFLNIPLFSFHSSNYTYIRLLDNVTHAPKNLFTTFFNLFFSVFLQLGNFYFFGFKFIDSSFNLYY